MLLGRITAAPQLKSSTSGVTLCTFTMAINRRFRASDGSQREETDFLDLSVFGKNADHCANYLKKGSLVFVEAHLKKETWKDKATNQNRSRLGLVADRVYFLDNATPIAEAGQTIADPEISQAFQQMPAMPPRVPPRFQQPMPAPPSPPIPPGEYGEIPY
ncbi:MAG: single-stranded DNA-binding protein [Victivallales bacterium]|nr:single-stranded DNA-binding protein [Victivallales bacterium]